ncbi:hypothetical protein DACRYDRAFT_109115 [Dacryopinax primogenitus]|uniref:Uncharacterized protein n=1 Tax=Dacryopinax primogenitus (strain DJM 731) TaxID=1858805 RepID=M5G3D3_DACPD|nr:uncharacterized protein DACRYDRAFT_109115 [Dacryopinax primogenitus]EJU00387.1 hypothetical protein DACRYDRAFT_109115 [Dacryopinax primogenitus]
MLKTAALIVAHMCKDAEDPRFSPWVKYSDFEGFTNAVMLLVNSEKAELICNLLEKWVSIFANDQQAELAALSALPNDESDEEKEFAAMLSRLLMSLAAMASPIRKAEKDKAKAKEMMPAKVGVPHANGSMLVMLPVTRAGGRPTKEDSKNVGWISEEMLATKDEAVVEEFLLENCVMFIMPQAHGVQGWGAAPECNIMEQAGRAVCLACKAAKKPCTAHIVHIEKAAALPAALVGEKLFLSESPKPTKKPIALPTSKKMQKLRCIYPATKPKKCQQEDNKDKAGHSQKWSHLPEAEIELRVVPLHMPEHKMLEMRKSLQVAQKAVADVTAWADQIQTLLGRALKE